MSTTIRISEDTKSRLAVLKEDDETWDGFLNRLARRERDVEELSGFADDAVVEDMANAREESREDWEQRLDT